MSKYSSKPTVVNKAAADLFSRFNDLSFFRDRLNSVPADKLAQIGDIEFDTDSISFVTPQVGELRFKVVERVEPSKVVFAADKSPLPLSMVINFKELATAQTEVSTDIDVDLPVMLRPFVGPKLQEAANKFGEMIANLSETV